jgi:alpha-L-arabinofuranosidase
MVGEAVPGNVESNRWYDIKVEVKGSRIRCYLDGKLVHDVEDRGPEPLSAVVGREEKTGDIIVKVANFSDRATETTLNLNGISRISPTATAITLTSGSPTDENTLEQPEKIFPVTKKVEGLGPTFRYTFPAYSVTVLRLKTK